MTQEALKLSQEALAGLKDVEKQVRELVAENRALKEALAQTQEPWCMKMNGCKTKCKDCPDEPPQRTEQEPPKYSFKAHWEKDGRIGVVAVVERLDGGFHVLEDIIDAPKEKNT